MSKTASASDPNHSSSDEGDDFVEADEFQDACELEAPPETGEMDLKRAVEEAEVAISYFFNNKFVEARNMMQPWVSSSMYHATGECVFAFLSASLTFDRELMADAGVKIKHAMHMCNLFRKRRTVVESIGTIVKKPSYDQYTDLEAHAELCFSEVLLLKATLTFMEDEELISLIKGSLKIKQCFNGYKECALILKERNWTDEKSKIHFESGVRMGMGSFNLMISLLPGRIIRILEFVGFSGDKKYGLQELLAGCKLDGGMRQVLCVMTLLGYHLVICYVITDQQGDLDLCDKMITQYLEIYPTGVWFLFFKARYEYIRGNLDKAISWYKKSWKSQNIWPQFHHICFWELMWIHCMSLDWREALLYSDFLLEKSKWSRTIYSYQKASAMFMIWDDLSETEKKTCNTLMQEAPSFKQRIAGKSLPMEKFVIKRCAKYNSGNRLLLPAIEMMFLWNMFRVFSSNFSVGDRVLKVIEKTEAAGVDDADDKALLLLMKGSVLRHLGAHMQAHLCLDSVISMKKQIKEDSHLIPYTIVELGLLFNAMGEKNKAIGALEDARKNYSKYSLESRLHFRIHTALTAIKE